MNRKAFQQILNELQEICPQLRLHLPTNAKAIEQQTRHLLVIQQHLENLIQRVYLLSIREQNSTMSHSYIVLAQLIENLAHEANNLALLAEESLIDAEGTLACLESVNQRKLKVFGQITHLVSRLNCGLAIAIRGTKSETCYA